MLCAEREGFACSWKSQLGNGSKEKFFCLPHQNEERGVKGWPLDVLSLSWGPLGASCAVPVLQQVHLGHGHFL